MVVGEEPQILQTALSSYEVYRRVAGGGFGTVHFGRDLGSNKPVAIKRLHSHLAYEPVLVRRFEQEAQRLRGLKHLNIVQVLDQGTDRGNVPFIILEWVDGWTLSSILDRRGRLPVEEVVEIACQALAALEVANQHGIVHRDIKPSNIMLTAPPEQIVKVMDFGIAKDTLAEVPGRQSIPRSARSPTWRRSSFAESPSTSGPICTLSASPCTSSFQVLAHIMIRWTPMSVRSLGSTQKLPRNWPKWCIEPCPGHRCSVSRHPRTCAQHWSRSANHQSDFQFHRTHDLRLVCGLAAHPSAARSECQSLDRE